MSKAYEKRQQRLGRKARVRKKVRGTGDRPRLSVFRSLNHIYAQLIDDDSGKTLASVSSLRLEIPTVEPVAAAPAEEEGKKEKKGKKKKKEKKPEGLKVRRSRAVGKAIAEKATGIGIKKVVFDRGGFLYHGRVAALAEAARKNGLEF
ncbi:MAG: 50S ribosomal protein L18 [Candidatus Krumholzibacteria bacterium]|nr:50S ribosomal protein L18 [Candidatus Krumholzibacteria bacterium]